MMIYVLVNTSMFMCLDNGCCLQLSGPSVENSARDWRRTSAIRSHNDDVRMQQQQQQGNMANQQRQIPQRIPRGRGSGGALVVENVISLQQRQVVGRQHGVVRNDQDNGAAGLRKAIELGPATQDPGMLLGSLGEESIDEEEEMAEVEENVLPVKKPTRRLSSWQRRKAQKAAAAAMEVDIEGGMFTGENSSLPSTQPLSRLEGQVEAQAGSSHCAGMPGSHAEQQRPQQAQQAQQKLAYGHSQWPRYMPKPSEMIINRSPVMYCSSFPVSPGFPARRTYLND